jgi:4-amino-4-deoxy-L-arabinose transferase-like glycosyltransferase
LVSHKTLWALLIALAVIWFGPIDYRKLAKPDEARYAEISREMAATGDWVTPRLNDLKYFEKPPLQYWATAAAYNIFGVSEGPARLWTALTGFAGILLTYFAGRVIFGREQGFFAAAVLASSLWYALLGHINTLDMGLAFFLTLSIFGLLLAQREHAKPRQQRNWMLVAWIGMALAVLSKGLIGIVLPGATLMLYSLLNRDMKIWSRLHMGKGLLLFFLISAPWFIAVSLANPEFAQFFFIHEHFDRFTKNDHDRAGPVHYFVPFLVAGIVPWLLALIPALLRGWKIERGYGEYRFHPNRFLLIWAVFNFVFFSISKSKLPAYILPLFPALALLIGQYLHHISAKKMAWCVLPISLMALVLTLATPFVLDYLPTDDSPLNVAEMNLRYAYWLMAAFSALFIGTMYGIRLLLRDARIAGVAAVSLSALIAWQLVWMGYETRSPLQSSYDIAQKIRPHLKPDTPIYNLGYYDQPLPFYLQRTVTLVNFQDELALGIKQEPHKWVPTVDEFIGKWLQNETAIAVMPSQMYQSLTKEKLLMQVIADDGRRVIIKKP